MPSFAGIDIGGTKCAVVLGTPKEDTIEILAKEKFPTMVGDSYGTLEMLSEALKKLIKESRLSFGGFQGIGISCGGPLDSKTGMILSPPNLPEWDHIPAAAYFQSAFQVPAVLDPDAVVIGSIFARSRNLLWDACDEVMKRECLPGTYAHCRVLPSELGDTVGDLAALSVTIDACDKGGCPS